ncbi:MAG: S8 family serine peptidase [Burkholderiaceae bacterium]
MNTIPRQVLPSDPLFFLQWHLLNTGVVPDSIAGFDINVVRVWPDYTGRGVLVGVLDQGADPNHPDLQQNYRTDLSWDVILNEPGGMPRSQDDNHGTPVSGLIAASAHNGNGGVGVAWDAEFVSYRNPFDASVSDIDIFLAFELTANKILESGVDVWNNSWTPSLTSFSVRDLGHRYDDVAQQVVEQGRDGLGTVILFSAGNGREDHLNSNDAPTTALPWAIAVAASSQRGELTGYSTPGASVLVTAPGSDPRSIVTTDRSGSEGYNTLPGAAGDYNNTAESFFNGTSSASPIAAGVVTLMLQANPQLGYRDVQEILVYSSKRATFLDQSYKALYNGSRDWNGGALFTSDDFGFGHVDALAAVRLAEVWTQQSTAGNLRVLQGQVADASLAAAAGSIAEARAFFADDARIEHVLVDVHLQTGALGAITLDLISPSGTVSRLIDTPPQVPDTDPLPDNLQVSLMSVRNWGESLAGEWTLRVSNAGDGDTVQLLDWTIRAHTPETSGAGRQQIFTDDFARFSATQGDRTVITSTDGTTLNAAAVTANTVLNLATGEGSIGGTAVTFADPGTMRHLYSGDGDDMLAGNAHSNVLLAGRGNNVVDGGAGVDVLRLVGEYDAYRISHTSEGAEIMSLGLSAGGTDRVVNTEVLRFDDQVLLLNRPVLLNDRLFDETGYLSWNPDVAAAVADGRVASAYAHYSQWGAREGRDPNALFNEAWYLQQYVDVALAVEQGALHSGFQHFMLSGWAEGRSPAAWMNAVDYLQGNPDVVSAGLNPLEHYLRWGIEEGRALAGMPLDLWG